MMIEWTEPRLIILSERKAEGVCMTGTSNLDCNPGSSADAVCGDGSSPATFCYEGVSA